jgi:hypothetical protein
MFLYLNVVSWDMRQWRRGHQSPRPCDRFPSHILVSDTMRPGICTITINNRTFFSISNEKKKKKKKKKLICYFGFAELEVAMILSIFMNVLLPGDLIGSTFFAFCR